MYYSFIMKFTRLNKYQALVLVTIFTWVLPFNLPAADDTLPIYSKTYDPKRDPIQDGIAALKLAQETNRHVLIEVGGDWCAWCHRLDKFLRADQQLYTDFFNTFVLVKVNVSEENDNKEFLKVFPPANGYPHMYVTDKNGSIIESKDTADFLVNKRYSVVKFYEFINKWKAK